MSQRPDPIVSTDWLADRLGRPGIKVLDASFFLPGLGDAEAAYRAAHIPGAIRFDIDAVADDDTALPHMLPLPEAFAHIVGAMGIGDGDHVVAYGAAGPRAWWMFRAMGHDAASVLDGGLAKWTAEGRPTETGDDGPRPVPAAFTARYRPELVRDFEAVKAALELGLPVLDARPGERFRGEAPEPRPGLASGHMPGAKSLPAGALLAPDGTLKPPEELAALLAGIDHDPSAPATATCGSGVTACVVALALARLGHWDTAVYDGSWSEWGARAGAAVARG